MTVNDSRTPLKQGCILTLKNNVYTVREVIGCGGSCLVYYAECETDEQYSKTGILAIPAIVKEFYPHELAGSIVREANGGLNIEYARRDAFNSMKSRFMDGAKAQIVFSVNDSNHSLPLPLADYLNGTAYTAVTLSKGQTLDRCAGILSMLEKADVFISLCNAVKNLHIDSKLYLDIKPSNIFVFDKDANESRRIALFDFDTVIAAADTAAAIISYSEGWSPYEQKHGQREQISYAADIYSIGAVFYWLLTGKQATDEVLNKLVRKRFEFLDEIDGLQGSKSRQATVAEILSSTLMRAPGKRAQSVDDIPSLDRLQQQFMQSADAPYIADLISEGFAATRAMIDERDGRNNPKDIKPNLPSFGYIDYCREYFNLFVVGGEEFKTGSFIISKTKALAEHIEPSVKEQFSKIRDYSVIEQILSFPSLFMSENADFMRSHPGQMVLFGRVTGLSIEPDYIKISFEATTEIIQQRITDMSQLLGIDNSPGCSELNNTHWTIKQADLTGILAEAKLLALP